MLVINIYIYILISEYSEDIYPYATFQLGENRQDDTGTAKFQSYVFQDERYGVTEGRPSPPSVSWILNQLYKNFIYFNFLHISFKIVW